MHLTTAATSMTSKWPLLWLSVRLIHALNDDAYVYSAIIQMYKHLNISIRIYLFYIMVCVLLFCALLRSLRVAHDYDYEQFCLNIFIRF